MNANNRWKHKMKAQGLCTYCGKKPIFKYCACLEHAMKAEAAMFRYILKHPKYQHAYYVRHRFEFYERAKSWRNRMKAEGRCVDCAKPNDNLPHIRCAECSEKQRERIAEWRARQKSKVR